jgi:hypothetical protein
MRKAAASLTLSLAVLTLPTVITAQAPELPNVPIVSSGWQEQFWTRADGTKFHYFEWGTGTPVILIQRIQRAHIGGFSMGGSITAQLLARAPERFITAHFGGSGVREEPDSEFAKSTPPDPKGTAPLDAEARKLYQARQAAEAAKAGVSNNPDDESNVSSQPVPAAVPRPPLDLKTITFPILAVVGEFDQPYTRTHRLWREAPNFQRVILRNRGHLSSYMAGLCPEVYRDALTTFIVSHNPADQGRSRSSGYNPRP